MSAVTAPGVSLLQPHEKYGLEVVRPEKTATPESAFGVALDHAVASANAQGNAADAAAKAFAAGSVDDIHGTMLALSKAEIELRYVGAVRNKIVDAFYELWRMQI